MEGSAINRREFVKLAGAGLAVSLLCGKAYAADEPKDPDRTFSGSVAKTPAPAMPRRRSAGPGRSPGFFRR